MGIQERINKDFNGALKKGQTTRRSVLGMVKSAIHNKEIEGGKQAEGLNDDEVLGVISSEAKKRKDSIDEFRKAEREDLVKQEEEELAVLEEYLPAQLSPQEVRAELEKLIAELSGQDRQNFGKVMAVAMKRLKGRANGQVVRAELEKLLGS